LEDEKELLEKRLDEIRRESLKELEDMERVINENERIKSDISVKAEQGLKEDTETKKNGHKVSILLIVLLIAVCGLSAMGLFVIKPALSYGKAVKLLNQNRFDEAENIFLSLNYKDSATMANECVVSKAQDLMEKGKRGLALVQLSRIKDFPEAGKLISESIGCGDEVIAVGGKHTVAVNSVGNVLATGDNSLGQCDVNDWNVKAVAAGTAHTVGLREDGSVLATGDNSLGQCNVTEWKDVAYVFAGGNASYAITEDGLVLATGDNSFGQCNINGLTGIIELSANSECAAALTEDGKIVLYGNKSDYVAAEGLTDVKSLSMNSKTLCVLKSDGTVAVFGANTAELEATISEWRDVACVAAGPGYVIAIKSDGEVISSTGSVSASFVNLQRVECGTNHIIALTIDGKLVSVGKNEWNECSVSDWCDIMSR
jgi:alpha-tubulin suppressor-like RCC1 family protein